MKEPKNKDFKTREEYADAVRDYLAWANREFRARIRKEAEQVGEVGKQ